MNRWPERCTVSAPTPVQIPHVDVVPSGETSCERLNPDSRAATVEALRTVTLYTISDAFDLCWQETSAVSFRLDRIFAPLLDHHPHQVPWAVRREMLDGSFTLLVSRRQETWGSGGQRFDHQVLHASVEEWTEILLTPIFDSYDLNPVMESRMYFEVLAMLKDLGVGDEKNPRASMYLPTDLRLRLMSRDRTGSTTRP